MEETIFSFFHFSQHLIFPPAVLYLLPHNHWGGCRGRHSLPRKIFKFSKDYWWKNEGMRKIFSPNPQFLYFFPSSKFSLSLIMKCHINKQFFPRTISPPLAIYFCKIYTPEGIWAYLYRNQYLGAIWFGKGRYKLSSEHKHLSVDVDIVKLYWITPKH